MMNGLNKINIELSSKCNRSCWMCGRRKRDKLFGDQTYGFMEWETLVKIPSQLPAMTLIAFHNNGEALLYPKFGKAVSLFKHCITYVVSNGSLLVEKAPEIISNLDIISISIIESEEPDIKEFQKEQIMKFLELKGTKSPQLNLRFVGDVDESYYDDVQVLKVRRTIHSPEGSRGYRKSPVIPEHGLCQDLLTGLAIDRYGDVSVCVRYDVGRELVLGNINHMSLNDIWNSQKRLYILNQHIKGKRDVLEYCGKKCEFFGVPTV